jgi:hypothetical protein
MREWGDCPDQIPVELTEMEHALALYVGVQRRHMNIWRNIKIRYGFPKNSNGWDIMLEGTCAEMAFAKHMGTYWSGNVGDWEADDVGPYQVRATWSHDNRLMLHTPEEGDKPEKIFVLLTGLSPKFLIRGWMWAQDGQLREYWEDPQHNGRWAFFVPRYKLQPMRNLPT